VLSSAEQMLNISDNARQCQVTACNLMATFAKGKPITPPGTTLKVIASSTIRTSAEMKTVRLSCLCNAAPLASARHRTPRSHRLGSWIVGSAHLGGITQEALRLKDRRRCGNDEGARIPYLDILRVVGDCGILATRYGRGPVQQQDTGIRLGVHAGISHAHATGALSPGG
jgi:hypothetical protein